METEAGETLLALGGSGGSRIFGSVAQVLLNLDWGFDVANAVEQPRVHDQLSPAYVSVESGYRPDLVDALRERGHNITIFDVNLGIAETQLVLRKESGKFFGQSRWPWWARSIGLWLTCFSLPSRKRSHLGLAQERRARCVLSGLARESVVGEEAGREAGDERLQAWRIVR